MSNHKFIEKCLLLKTKYLKAAREKINPKQECA